MTSITPTTGVSVPITTATAEAEAANKKAAERVASKELDKNAFLQLLVAQLKYQDPSKPMDSNEFMTQNAQLTSLEKMTDLANTSREAFATQQKLSAASLVGRNISFKATDGSTQSGTVSAATLSGDTPSLTVAGNTVPLDTVISVTATAA